MSQATVDVAALDAQPAAGSTNTNTDDLLSKMAGEEIDRLLAEAEAGHLGTAPPAGSVATPSTAAVAGPPPAAPANASDADAALADQLDDLISGLENPPPSVTVKRAVPAPETPTAPSPSDPPPVTEAVPPAPVAEPSPAVAPQAAPPAPAAKVAPVAALPTPLAAAEEARLKKLAEDLELDKSPPTVQLSAAPAAQLAPATSIDDGKIPFFLLPLVWLNLPVAGCNEKRRSIMGKAALVTLANAIVLMACWALFKKHH